MIKNIITSAVTALVVTLIVFGLVGGFQSAPKAGGTTNFDALTLDSGDLTISSGAVSVTSTGTTTASFLSTSATKGFCMSFNATSTNTLLNLTYAASSTAYTTVGVAPIIRFGACN